MDFIILTKTIDDSETKYRVAVNRIVHYDSKVGQHCTVFIDGCEKPLNVDDTSQDIDKMLDDLGHEIRDPKNPPRSRKGNQRP